MVRTIFKKTSFSEHCFYYNNHWSNIWKNRYI